MAILLTILKRRVEYDKDALFQFTQLRKELKVESEHVVAPLLMRYSHACEQVRTIIYIYILVSYCGYGFTTTMHDMYTMHKSQEG